jgi:hypothetical protein
MPLKCLQVADRVSLGEGFPRTSKPPRDRLGDRPEHLPVPSQTQAYHPRKSPILYSTLWRSYLPSEGETSAHQAGYPASYPWPGGDGPLIWHGNLENRVIKRRILLRDKEIRR